MIGYWHPGKLALPNHGERGGKVQHRPSLRNHEQDAADGDHHSQGDDEGVYLHLGDEKPVHHSHPGHRQQGQDDGDGRRDACNQGQAAHHPGESQSGAHGEVQSAGDQEDGHAHHDGAFHGKAQEDGLDVGPRRKTGEAMAMATPPTTITRISTDSRKANRAPRRHGRGASLTSAGAHGPCSPGACRADCRPVARRDHRLLREPFASTSPTIAPDA